MSTKTNFQLKNWFDHERFAAIGDALAECQPGFDRRMFLRLATTGLEPLSILQRMRHGTRALHATLPTDYPAALAVLRELAPRINHTFVGMMLPDYVGQYGLGHFDESMKALHWLTRFSSGEFAIREFLQRDLVRTLAVMKRWSHDENEHVRRLASEGSRPRLPWSFRLEAMERDPSLAAPILENLRADPSLYVRKSVANHLNDISKSHPEWLLSRLKEWELTQPHTRWIAKRAARTLIKAGNQHALALFDFGAKPAVRLTGLHLTPSRLRLGGSVELAFTLASLSAKSQRLAVDYRVHYVRADNTTSPKVFKLKEVTLPARGKVSLTKQHACKNFTTRRHYAGRHRIEVQVNGRIVGEASFQLEL